LIDWIKHDPAVPASAKADVQGLYDDYWLRLCGDLATAAKHFQLTTRVPVASEVSATQGYGRGRYGKGAFGVGEEQIDVQLPDGTSYSLLDFVSGVNDSWALFCQRHGLAT
jgi:hypothetical protein